MIFRQAGSAVDKPIYGNNGNHLATEDKTKAIIKFWGVNSNATKGNKKT